MGAARFKDSQYLVLRMKTIAVAISWKREDALRS